jgi:hypothetical protein
MTSNTITKPRQTTKSAFAELAELDAAIVEAEGVGPLLEQERATAAGNLAEARGHLQAFYGAGNVDRDENEHERLVKAVRDAENAANRQWQDELIGLGELHSRAVGRRDAFLDENRDRLAAELVERATAVRERVVAAREALIATQGDGHFLSQQWDRVLGPLERPAGGEFAGGPRRRRLADLPLPSVHPNSRSVLQKQQALVDEAIERLRQVDVTALRRMIPLELDTDFGGTPPEAP